jgi:hypothetical protein
MMSLNNWQISLNYPCFFLSYQIVTLKVWFYSLMCFKTFQLVFISSLLIFFIYRVRCCHTNLYFVSQYVTFTTMYFPFVFWYFPFAWHNKQYWLLQCNVKVKVFLCFFLNWAPRYEGAFSTSALDGGEWSASRSGRFTPQGKGPWYPLDRRLGGSQSRSGHGGEEKNSQSLPGIEPPIIQPVAQRYTTELSDEYVF